MVQGIEHKDLMKKAQNMVSCRAGGAAGGKFCLADDTEGFPKCNSKENTNTKAQKVVKSHDYKLSDEIGFRFSLDVIT